MTIRFQLLCVLLAIVVLGFTGYSSGQTATGTPPMGSFGGDFDTVNLANLNVHFAVPVVHKAGRGLPFSYLLGYDSSIWYPVGVSGSQTWTNVQNWGWHALTEADTGYVSYATGTFKCFDGSGGWYWATRYTNWNYHDPSGTVHKFNNVTVDSCNGPDDVTATAADGSGYTIDVPGAPPAVVGTRSGAIINAPHQSASGAGTISDSNGNQLTTDGTTFTDTLATTALTISGNSAPGPMYYSYARPGGGTASVTVTYTQKTVQTNFQCSGISEYGPQSQFLVTSIAMPDGTSYGMQYEQTPGGPTGYVTGRISQITLPTGGTISYAYNNSSFSNTVANGGIMCADGSTAGLARTVTPGGNWTYARSGANPAWNTVVTDPLSQTATILFYTDSTYSRFYEVQRELKNSAGSDVAIILNCYNNAACYSGGPVTTPITSKAIITHLPNASGRLSCTSTSYNTYGLPTAFLEYDFGSQGSDACGPLLRQTYTTYASLGNGIVDRLSQITVQDANGNIKAQTNNTYTNTVTATTGTPQHVAVTGDRGNVGTISRWAQGSTYLTTSFSYFDTGLVQTAIDVNGAPTTYTYGECGNSFLTSTAFPLSLATSAHWDCNGGVVVWTKDANQQQTTYSYYDPNQDSSFWTDKEIDLPDGGKTNYVYNTHGSSNWSIAQTSTIDSTNNVVTTTRFDGLGRTTRQELNSDPDGTTYTDTTYDSLGRVASVSNPYRSPSDPTYGFTTYQYDALNRITLATNPDNTTRSITYSQGAVSTQDEGNGTRPVQRVLQNDGLGRLISSCEVTGAQLPVGTEQPAACGQDIGATGFKTSYGYDALGNLLSVTQGVQSRSYAYDGLSRLTSESTPESGTITTTTYVYDGSGAVGDLYQRISPMPNQIGSQTVTTTYGYDALHRLTSRAYNYSGTPNAYFSYDQGTAWGVAVSNGKGRLTSAYNNANTSNVYSYDVMGRVISDNHCANSNCSTTPTFVGPSYAYDLAGDLTTLGLGQVVTLYYAYNTARQLSGITSNLIDSTHPSPLLSGPGWHSNTVQYNALGQPIYTTFGNAASGHGINDQRTFDKSGRLLTVWTNVNNGPGLLAVTNTYTPNGNLHTTNDSVVGPWTYTYDDFNRLLQSVESGTGWPSVSYSYDYDRYGNRWHQNAPQGGPAPQYSFDVTTNRIALGNGISYDAPGNVTADAMHGYSWDAEGHVLTVDGGTTATYVYDALGRRVSKTVSGSTTYFSYDGQGHLISEYTPTVWIRGEVYAGDRHVATYVNGQTYFSLPDGLGSERVRSTQDGNLFESVTNLAFGESNGSWGNSPNVSNLHFAGLLRDSESGLDDTLFRKYSSTQGRWMRPDPAGLAAADPSNPQSWNRYAYVANNPVNAIDPLGLWFPGDCMEDPACPAAGPGGGGYYGGWGPDLNTVAGIGGAILGGILHGSGSGGGGGGTGGTTGSGPNTGGLPPMGGPPVGNALLGFHLLCAGTVAIPPGSPGQTPSTWTCAVYFLGLKLGTVQDLVKGFIVGGTVAALAPIPQTGGKLAAGLAFPVAFSAQGFSCIGGGLAVGSPGRAFNFGPLTGNVGNARNVLSGPSFSGGVQGPGVQGYQFVWNLSGGLFGPTVGTPGWSLAGTVSWCPSF